MTQMPRRKGSGRTQVSVMILDAWVERLDALAERQSALGEVVARADVLRKCIQRGLDVLEAEHPPEGTKRRRGG
jgi:hypothetical protein